MTRLACILALLASPAMAGERLSFTPDTDPSNGIFGRIVVVNIVSVFDRIARFETTRGPVVIQYETTYNAPCPELCPDSFSILSLPPGIIAIPPEGQIAEDETITILLMEYMGG